VKNELNDEYPKKVEGKLYLNGAKASKKLWILLNLILKKINQNSSILKSEEIKTIPELSKLSISEMKKLVGDINQIKMKILTKEFAKTGLVPVFDLLGCYEVGKEDVLNLLINIRNEWISFDLPKMVRELKKEVL